MTTLHQLVLTKDPYARAWAFMAAAKLGATHGHFLAPNGARYELTEVSFGRTPKGIMLTTSPGEYSTMLEPGKTYRLAQSGIFQGMVLDVVIDVNGKFHILNDSIFRTFGLNLATHHQVKSYCNNRNLCDEVELFNFIDHVKTEGLTVRGSDLRFENARYAVVSFAGKELHLGLDEFTGFTLKKSNGAYVRQYTQQTNLMPIDDSMIYFADTLHPLKAPDRDLVSILLGEIQLALDNDPKTLKINVELLDGMSESTEDLYFLYNDGLLLCDRISGERLLVPSSDDLPLITRIGDGSSALRIKNSGVPALLSNTI